MGDLLFARRRLLLLLGAAGVAFAGCAQSEIIDPSDPAGMAGTTGAAGVTASAGTNGGGGTVTTGGTTGTGAAGRGGSAGAAGRGGTTAAAGTGVPADGGPPATFTQVYSTIVQVYCGGQSCHFPGNGGGLSMSSKANAYRVFYDRALPGNGAGSGVYITLESGAMPREQPKLSAANLALVKSWIDDGALNN
jgi:hypothetical protein